MGQRRVLTGAVGAAGVCFALAILTGAFAIPVFTADRETTADERRRQFFDEMSALPWVAAAVVAGVALMHAAALLVAQAVYAPPRSRMGLFNHLLLAFTAASILTFLPFALLLWVPW